MTRAAALAGGLGGRGRKAFSWLSPDSPPTPRSTAVESTGTAKAEAESRAEALRIEGEGSVLQAKLKAEALAIETVSRGVMPVGARGLGVWKRPHHCSP